jgi:acetyl-CoA C-acetyltransferase
VPGDDRLPVIVASGQVLERADTVGVLDLVARAADLAFEDAKALRDRVDVVSVVNMLTPAGPAPAAALARRVGVEPSRTEVSTIGGNSPQMLVTRAAAAIGAGQADVVLVAGGEAQRSQRIRREAGAAGSAGGGSDDRGGGRHDDALGPDEVVGDDRPGMGEAETAAGLVAPVNVYALFESAIAHRAGHGPAEHRTALAAVMAPFTEVAAGHPCAWFPTARSAGELAAVSTDNRLVSDPFTKRLCAVLGVDQAAAVLVTSLGAARAAGLADHAVFVSSATALSDVWFPAARPDLGRSPAIAAAVAHALAAAGLGIDDIGAVDLYSCFPCVVEMAAEAIGIALDDPRGLTVTGGLPYFGGPGNNYTLHAICTMTDRLRAGGGSGLVTGIGWYATKHTAGVYSSTPPAGFTVPDTAVAQAAIDETAVPVAAGVDDGAGALAEVVGATVAYGPGDVPIAAPVIARLEDGRHVAAAARAEVALGELAGTALVGRSIVVSGTPPRYRLEG